MQKRLYIAYGSNLNLQQMKYRCPTARLYGTGVIEDYELQFKGQPKGAYATIGPKIGSQVPVAVWELKARDELALDRYEGFPYHYFKEDLPVRMDGEEQDVTAMVYIMNLKMEHGIPSRHYFTTVYEGYEDCGLDTSALMDAVHHSIHQYHERQKAVTQASFFDSDFGVSEDNVENEMDEQDEGYQTQLQM